MNGAYWSSDRILGYTVPEVGGRCALVEGKLWGFLDNVQLHILIEVAIIQVWCLGADEEQGFWPILMRPEWAGPNPEREKGSTLKSG